MANESTSEMGGRSIFLEGLPRQVPITDLLTRVKVIQDALQEINMEHPPYGDRDPSTTYTVRPLSKKQPIKVAHYEDRTVHYDYGEEDRQCIVGDRLVTRSNPFVADKFSISVNDHLGATIFFETKQERNDRIVGVGHRMETLSYWRLKLYAWSQLEEIEVVERRGGLQIAKWIGGRVIAAV